jgi:hypothetical protein
MRDFARTLLLLGIFGLLIPSTRAQTSDHADCEGLCANLADSIQRHPGRLVMWLEDALVIRQSCAAQIVQAAMDAVGNEPRQVRLILETALNVAPQQSKQIQAAIHQFSIPSAIKAVEPVEEIRRAVVAATTEMEPMIEVRRALSPQDASTQPLEEIRRAVLPPHTAAIQPMTSASAPALPPR